MIECRGDERPTRLEDAEFEELILANAGPVCDTGKAVKSSELAKQLDRLTTSESLSFGEPSKERLAPAEIYRRSVDRVFVLAHIYKCKRCTDWHTRISGAAFPLTADGVFVTCRHLFETDTDDRVVVADYEGKVYPVTELIVSSAPDDLLLFRVEGTDFKPVTIGRTPELGAEVTVVSHPASHFYLMTRGSVARHSHRARLRGSSLARAKEPATPTIDITAEFGSGSSGSPVFDEFGNVVAIASRCDAVLHSTEAPVPQMWVRRCVPADRLKLLRKNDAESPSP